MSSARRVLPTPPTYHTPRRPRQVGILAAMLLASLLTLALALPQAAVSASDPGAGAAAKADNRDFGDAPDGAPAGYEGLANVVGNFPAKKESRGASHRQVGKLLLGAKVTAEGNSRQVDRDLHDDGFSAIVRECERTAFHFVVNASRLPDRVLRKNDAFLNVWADWNRDGDWRDRASCVGNGDVPEWAIENRRLKLKSFINDPIQTITVETLAGASGPQLWMRASVSDKPFANRVKVNGQRIRNDGRGTFRLGETEDYFVFADGPADDSQEPAEVADCNPSGQQVLHGTQAQVFFSIVDGGGNPVNVAEVRVLTKNLPAGWAVQPNFPPNASATVLIKKDGPDRTQRGTIAFLVRSQDTLVPYQVSCELEVVHFKKKAKLPKGDFGDAPDGVVTKGTALEPLCKNSDQFFTPFFCRYPSLAPGGPVHTMPRPIHLGNGVTSEGNSNQVNADKLDDGFSSLVTHNGCNLVVFEWNVVVENPKAKRFQGKKNKQERKALERLIRQIKTGRANIFINAWFDAANDGEWDVEICPVSANQAVDAPDHAISDEKLTREELKSLSKPRRNGKRLTSVVRLGLVGPIAPEGPGCERGTISVGQRFHPGVSGTSSHITGGRVLHPYRLGETEDNCFPGEEDTPDSPGTPDTPGGGDDGVGKAACSDGADNDGDGKVDSADPGCLSGPNGAYDPDDESEEDLTGSLFCPRPEDGQLIFSGILSPSGSQIFRHVVRFGGAVVLSDDPGAEGGTAGPFDVTCVGGTVVRIMIAWTSPEPGKLKYDFFIENRSGPGDDSIVKSVAANTR